MRLKKFLIILQVVLYSATLVSCSSSKTISFDEGVLTIGRDSIKVTELRPTRASKDNSLYTAEYSLCPDVERCSADNLGVLVENMDKLNDALYYTRYHKTEMVVHLPLGEEYTEAVVKTKEEGADASVFLNEVVEDISNLNFQAEYTSVEYGKDIAINVQGMDFRISVPDNIVVIPNVVRVSKKQIPQGASSITVGETILKKVSTDKSDYYEYKGNSIQAAKGVDISSIITFK